MDRGTGYALEQVAFGSTQVLLFGQRTRSFGALCGGGEDMGARSMRDLIRDVKCDFLRLSAAFPRDGHRLVRYGGQDVLAVGLVS